MPTRENGKIIDASWFNDIENKVDGSVANHSDVNLDTPATNGQALVYDSVLGAFKAQTVGAGSGNLTIASKTANYTAAVGELVLASGAAFNITLPTAVGNGGKVVAVKKTDSSISNLITVDTTSSQTIDLLSSITLCFQHEVIYLVSDNVNWVVLSYFPGVNPVIENNQANAAYSGNIGQWHDQETFPTPPGLWRFKVSLQCLQGVSGLTEYVGFGTVSGNTSPGSSGLDYATQTVNISTSAGGSLNYSSPIRTITSLTTYYLKVLHDTAGASIGYTCSAEKIGYR